MAHVSGRIPCGRVGGVVIASDRAVRIRFGLSLSARLQDETWSRLASVTAKRRKARAAAVSTAHSRGQGVPSQIMNR